MRIEALYEGWQLQCCGTPFAVGDTVTWPVFAAEPRVGAELPRYVENHHGPAEDQSPTISVTGVVEALSAVYEPTVEVPGERVCTNDTDHRVEVAVDGTQAPPAASVPVGGGLRHYLATLVVPDSTELPAYSPPPWRADVDRRRADARTYWKGLVSSPVGRALGDLADSIERRHGDRVHVVRSQLTTGVTVRPNAPGACAIRWLLRDAELRVGIGDGDWMFDPTLEQVAVIRNLVEEAAAGRVRETVLPGLLRTTVTDAEGHEYQASVPYPEGDGLVAGALAARWQRGDVDYRAW